MPDGFLIVIMTRNGALRTRWRTDKYDAIKAATDETGSYGVTRVWVVGYKNFVQSTQYQWELIQWEIK